LFTLFHSTCFDNDVQERLNFLETRLKSHLIGIQGGERAYTCAVYKVVFDTKTQFHVRYHIDGFAFKTIRQLLGYFTTYIVGSLYQSWSINTFNKDIYLKHSARTPFSTLSIGEGMMEEYKIPENYQHDRSFVGNVDNGWEMFDICEGTETGLAPIDIFDETKNSIIQFIENNFKLEAHYFVNITKYEDTLLYFNHNFEKCLITQKEHPQVNHSIKISKTALTYVCNDDGCEGCLNPIKIYLKLYPPLLKAYFNRTSQELTDMAGMLINMNSDAGVNTTSFNYESS
jgi:hypothetical protein